jgi:hypothetical protein
MELPGGLLLNGRLRRDYRFHAVTGELERALTESGFYADTLPQQVTRVLTHSLSEVAGQVVDEALVRALSAGDRQYLILQLEALIDAAPRWVTVPCAGCAEPVQFQVRPDNLPMKPAGQGYPLQRVNLSLGEVKLRVPNGADEEFISTRGEADDRAQLLLLSRLLTLAGDPVDLQRLDDADLETLDRLLDEMSPQAGLRAAVDCPYCRLAQEVEIDPYAWLLHDTEGLDEQIHTLAFHYHWSEREILQLPRHRRERYLQLIDRSLGRYRADDLVQDAPGGSW